MKGARPQPASDALRDELATLTLGLLALAAVGSALELTESLSLPLLLVVLLAVLLAPLREHAGTGEALTRWRARLARASRRGAASDDRK